MKMKKFKDFLLKESKNIDVSKSRLDLCVDDILEFLKDNNIKTWDQFTTTGRFDRWVVDSIIDSNCENMDELREVRYRIRLNLSNKQELQEMLAEYEQDEEYEKCQEIKDKIDSI